jgi:hypothetical protein
MHYKTEVLVFELESVDEFLNGKQVQHRGSTVDFTAGDLPPFGSGVVWVLEPAGALP